MILDEQRNERTVVSQGKAYDLTIPRCFCCHIRTGRRGVGIEKAIGAAQDPSVLSD